MGVESASGGFFPAAPLFSGDCGLFTLPLFVQPPEGGERLADDLVHVVIAVGGEPPDERHVVGLVRERLGLATPNVWFVGRLATYRYYNMDQIVGQALATFRRINEALPADQDTSPARVMKPAAALAS